MKQALAVALSLTAGSLSAQRHGGGRMGSAGPIGPVGHGFGNVVFPGTGIPNPVPGHATALGAAVRGVYPGGAGAGWYRPQRPAAVAYPIAVPVPVYGYDYSGFAPQMPVQQQYYPQPLPQPQPQQPTVIINQHYSPDRAQPVVREYGSTELGSYQAPVPDHPAPPPSAAPAAPVKVDDDTPTVFLIALKDGTVYSAYAYWVEGDTLHYITTKHSHNRATVDLVDSDLSRQLNRERKVDFKLRPR